VPGALVLLGLGVARAQPDDDAGRARARELLEQGSARFDKGDAAGALECFEQAIAAYPSPRIQFNRGLALRELGRTGEAVEALRTFLDEAVDAADRARTQARQMLAALEPKVGWIRVETETPGLFVFVDGRLVATTPTHRPIAVDPGERTVRVGRPGAVAQQWRLALVPGPAVGLRISSDGKAETSNETSNEPSTTTGTTLTPPPAPPTEKDAALSPPPPPLHARPVFWIGAAAVVGAGVAAFFLLRRPAELPRGSLGAQDLR
jgi:hypothetical protein